MLYDFQISYVRRTEHCLCCNSSSVSLIWSSASACDAFQAIILCLLIMFSIVSFFLLSKSDKGMLYLLTCLKAIFSAHTYSLSQSDCHTVRQIDCNSDKANVMLLKLEKFWHRKHSDLRQFFEKDNTYPLKSLFKTVCLTAQLAGFFFFF